MYVTNYMDKVGSTDTRALNTSVATVNVANHLNVRNEPYR